MTVAQDDPRVFRLTLAEASECPDGPCWHYKDRYWAYDDGVLFWQPRKDSSKFPQCNSHEHVTQGLVKKLYPWAETRSVPSVFIRMDPGDF